MYSKPVLQRVKEGLGEEIFKVFFTPTSNGSKKISPETILQEFLQKALEELMQNKPVRRQLSLIVRPGGVVPLPSEVQAVEALWLAGKCLTVNDKVEALRSGEYAVDLRKRVIHLVQRTVGMVEVHCTAFPREEDLPPEAKHPLVLHVKAQCCEYIAEKLRTNPSKKMRRKNGIPNNPAHWEQEAQRLRQKFSEMVRVAY